MMDFDWKTITLIFAIVGYLNDVFDLVGNVVDLVKAIVKGAKWIINKIQNAKKK